MSKWFTVTEGQEPIVATAVHDGHELRPEVAALVALSDSDRLREEDPFTGTWTMVVGTRVVLSRSRFEVDLNRPRNKAVYLRPEDAWGLRVWREEPSKELLAASLEQYDYFYAEMHRVLTQTQERYGRFVVLDLHSYNHRRTGPDTPPDDPEDSPEVNVGTGSMDRERWGGASRSFHSRP
ncbi:MAG: N-formylglutamate amidohydrolase [Candidatus Dadabacteria bacterium]|nr:N-formylglutamate amidohydrolase [Candidatus Dadabacteria bacterium]